MSQSQRSKARKPKKMIKKLLITRRRAKVPELMPRKNQQCRQIIDSKICELCKSRDNDEQFILCDECDDAYHWNCLDPPLKQIPDEDVEWVCPQCSLMSEIQDEEVEEIPHHCRVCDKDLKLFPSKFKDKEPEYFNIFILKDPIKCSYCCSWFHVDCFSHRKSSLNCSNCESRLRRQGPKDHHSFIHFILNDQAKIKESNLFQLTDKKKSSKAKQTAAPLYLKLFNELADWELIVRYEASLYYALKTKKLTFCDEQLYESEEMIEMNDSSKEIVGVLPLSEADEEVYRQFKMKIRKGAVGPFEIKEDRKKGFYVEATALIDRGSIICEYTGEVSKHRDSLNKFNNDSIFTLLITGSSKQDLNIAPSKFGNMSRFICGVNNNDKQYYKNLNVNSVRFEYKGRVRILFVAKKNIEKGETLYLNYNAGTFEEYPTENFV